MREFKGCQVMISKKIFRLVRRLFQLTQENKLQWEETGHEGVYQLPVDDFIVRMAAEKSGEHQPPRYVLRVCNAKGIVLEEISDADINERVAESEEYMKDLYLRAHRSAMHVEAAIDRIINRLDEDAASQS